MGRAMMIGLLLVVGFPIAISADLVDKTEQQVTSELEGVETLPNQKSIDDLATITQEQDQFNFLAYEQNNFADMEQINNQSNYTPVTEAKNLYLVSGFFVLVFFVLKYRSRKREA